MASAELSSYVGQVHYRDGAGQDYFARAAVWCADRAGFDDALSNYLEAQDQALLWSEDVFEAIEWLKKFGHNGTVTTLARQVSETNPVAMSEGKAKAGGDENYSPAKLN